MTLEFINSIELINLYIFKNLIVIKSSNSNYGYLCHWLQIIISHSRSFSSIAWCPCRTGRDHRPEVDDWCPQSHPSSYWVNKKLIKYRSARTVGSSCCSYFVTYTWVERGTTASRWTPPVWQSQDPVGISDDFSQGLQYHTAKFGQNQEVSFI